MAGPVVMPAMVDHEMGTRCYVCDMGSWVRELRRSTLAIYTFYFMLFILLYRGCYLLCFEWILGGFCGILHTRWNALHLWLCSGAHDDLATIPCMLDVFVSAMSSCLNLLRCVAPHRVERKRFVLQKNQFYKTVLHPSSIQVLQSRCNPSSLDAFQ